MRDFSEKDIKVKRIIRVFINSTIDIIQDEGLESVTVRSVAKKSGYNAATIYNYFDNSRQLILFASLSFLKDYFKDIQDIIKSNDEEPIKQYIKLWKIFCRYSYQNPKIYYSIFGENIDEDFKSLIDKYFKVFPENFDYSPADYLPVLTDSYSVDNITKPLLECIELGCISKEDAKMIDEASMLYYHGMLSLMVNKRVKYSVKEATEKTINHIKQIIRNVSGLKDDIGKYIK
ncbi:MAG: TetR/AcrR family transcriptional regulator [Halanaerobiales bacterium]|nr:TetR/AcrR family transcriptional regulator [Halanaerobiales bacterium]